jgi:hypothetical protein
VAWFRAFAGWKGAASIWLAIGATGCPCAGDGHCEGNTAVNCESQSKLPYDARATDDCDRTHSVCVEREGAAFCALDTEPSPVCEGLPSDVSFCQQDHVVRCWHGFVAPLQECQADRTCVLIPDSEVEARCVEADPPIECPEAFSGYACLAGNATLCEQGFVRLRTPCEGADLCQLLGGVAECLVPGDQACDSAAPLPFGCYENAIVKCSEGRLTHEGKCPYKCEEKASDTNNLYGVCIDEG